MFFSFQAILSILPFAFKYEGILHRDSEIGLLYIGYFIGIVVSLFASRIIASFHGRTNAIIVGFFIFGASIFCMRTLDSHVVFWLMFLFCTGSFVIYSLLSVLLNTLFSSKGYYKLFISCILLCRRRLWLLFTKFLLCCIWLEAT